MGISAEEKARQLVNVYYGHSKSQRDAIQIVDNIVLTRLCQDIDSLHGHVFHQEDYDVKLVEGAILQLKNWQEVALELSRMREKLPV